MTPSVMTRSRVLPIAERAHRNPAPYAVAPGTTASALTGRHRPRRRQAAVDRGGAHQHQLLAHPRVQGQVAVPLECRHQGRQQRLQALPAHAVRCLPQHDQPLGHGLVVHRPAPPPYCRRGRVSVQDSDGVLAVVPGERGELVQDPPPRGWCAPPISLDHGRHQLPSPLRTHRRHRASLR